MTDQLTTLQKLQELSSQKNTLEFNGQSYEIKPFNFKEGKEFIDEKSVLELDEVVFNACIESFADNGERIAHDTTYSTVEGLIANLPGGFVQYAGSEMLIKSFGENYLDHFQQAEEVKESYIQEVTIDSDGRNVANG